jgi:FSR family fosmidomycin resistance protein-like MFS transporter
VSLAESDFPPLGADDTTFRPGAVLTVASGHLIHDTYIGFGPILLPRFVDRFALSNTRAGWLAACTQLPSILQPVFGYLADRMLLRWVVVATPAATATVMSLTGWAPAYPGLVALLLLVGLSSAAFHAVGSATAGHLSERHLGKGLSVWMVGGEMGIVIGPLLVGTALAWLTLKGLAWLMVPGWTASILLHRRLRRAPVHRVQRTGAPHWRPALREMRALLGLMVALIVLRSLAVSAPAVFSPLLLEGEGKSRLAGAVAVTIYQAAGMLGTLVAGWASDRLGRRTVLLIGAVAGAAGLLGFVAVGAWPRFGLLAVAGAATLSMHPVCMALVQETFPQQRGLANALYLSAVFVISSAAAVGVGILGDAIGLTAAFVVAGLVTLLSVPLLLRLPKGG